MIPKSFTKKASELLCSIFDAADCTMICVEKFYYFSVTLKCNYSFIIKIPLDIIKRDYISFLENSHDLYFYNIKKFIESQRS